MTAPLAHCRILVTRPETDAGPLVTALEALGAHVETLATIRIVQASNLAALDAALASAASADWWAFTSANAVRAVAERLAGSPWPKGPRLAAVGPATARAVEQACGRVPEVVPERHHAAGLLEALTAAGARPGERVFLPRGSLATPELPTGLEAAGLLVEACEAYGTRPGLAPDQDVPWLESGRFDWVVFASGSAFRALFAVPGAGGWLRGVSLATLGPGTSEVIRAWGLEVKAQAKVATPEGLGQAIVAAHRP